MKQANMNIANKSAAEKCALIVDMFEPWEEKRDLYDECPCSMGVIAQSLDVCDEGEDCTWHGTKKNIAEALGVPLGLIEEAEAIHDDHIISYSGDPISNRIKLHRKSYMTLIRGIKSAEKSI